MESIPRDAGEIVMLDVVQLSKVENVPQSGAGVR